MNLRSLACWAAALLSCPHVLAQSSGANAKAPEAASASPKPMEAAFHNIQVLKGVPSTELLPVMNFIRSSLGVRCEYCHVAENGKYQLDVKPQKQRAREMILMTRQLNQTSFNGTNVVTCNTCHQGMVTPAAVPQIGSKFVNTTRREPDEPTPAPLPTVNEVFAHYEAATRISALPPLRITLQGSHAKVVDSGTYGARVVARGETRTGGAGLIDGDRAFGRSPLPNGQFMLVGSNGKRAWILGPDGLHWIPDSEFVQFQRKLNPLLALRVRGGDFIRGEVSDTEIVGNREAYVVTATGTDGTMQKLWFAIDDGLLLRRTFYHPIAMGLDPEQFDFSDYKNYDGIQLPEVINTSYLDDQHLGVLKKIVAIKMNVPVTDRDFMPPDK